MERMPGEPTHVDFITDFVVLAVKNLVREPDKVKIDVMDSGGKSLCIVVSCDSADVPLIVGHSGNNILALRTLVWSIAKKRGYTPTVIVNG